MSTETPQRAQKLRRIAVWMARIVGGLLALVVLVILTLYAAQAWSVHKAERMIAQLELLRPGAPTADFLRVVGDAEAETSSNGDITYRSGIEAGPWRWHWLNRQIWDLSDRWHPQLNRAINACGLQTWFVSAYATTHAGRIVEIDFGAWIHGRYETLGVEWSMEPYPIQPRYKGDVSASTPRLQRASHNWFHITSSMSGEGIAQRLSTQSTPEELAARHINTKCLNSFGGCRGLCELLPEYHALYKNTGGAVCGIPSAPCDPPDKISACKTSGQ